MDSIRNLSIATTALLISTTQADVLYDLAPVTDSCAVESTLVADETIFTPSSINVGELPISPNYKGLEGNWVLFNTPECGIHDQIQFDLPLGQEEIYVSADIHTEAQNGSDNLFTINVDSSDYSGRSLQFHGLGMLRLFNSGGTGLGTYSDDTTYAVDIYANAVDDVITISVDGNLVHTGTLGSTDLTSIRMTQARWTGAATDCGEATIAVSNFKIYENPADLTPQTGVFDIDFELLASNIIPANGTTLPYSRTITNTDLVNAQKQLSWVSIDLPSGEAYTLRKHTGSSKINAGVTYTQSSSVSIPKWLPAGDYQLTYTVMDKADTSVQSTSVAITKTE